MSGLTDRVDTDGRVVVDVADRGRVHASRVVGAGPLAFFGGTAHDEDGRLAAEVAVPPPYGVSPAAHAVRQGAYVFDRVADGLAAVGSGLDQIVQVEQFTPRKAFADGYIVTRGDYLREARPTTALAATGALVPDGAVVCAMGIAARAGTTKEIAPLPPGEEGGAIDWAQLGDAYEDDAPYNDVVLAGPYAFITGDVALDPETGEVDPAARVPDWIWAGSEARNEARLLLDRLGERMGRLGGSLDDLVHVTVFVTDIADLFEIDRVWRRVFGDTPPARTIIPVRGLGVPRREGERLGHADRAVKLEQQVRAVRPGHGVARELVATARGRFAHEAEAVKAGPLVWISHQYAEPGAYRSSGEEVDQLFARLDEVCRAAGTTIGNLAQLRAFVRDPAIGDAVYARLRALVPTDPPVVAITEVPGPLLVPTASLFVDAVAYVPSAS